MKRIERSVPVRLDRSSARKSSSRVVWCSTAGSLIIPFLSRMSEALLFRRGWCLRVVLSERQLHKQVASLFRNVPLTEPILATVLTIMNLLEPGTFLSGRSPSPNRSPMSTQQHTQPIMISSSEFTQTFPASFYMHVEHAII